MSDTQIPIILITGFLGAGKTTLVNRLLTGNLGSGAGLLVNDFGDVVVDGCLVKSGGDNRDLQVFEVAGGSIFCSCKTENFALGLKMFARLRPRRLFIEASGMSDPSGLNRLLEDYRLAADFIVFRTLCVTDTVSTPKMLKTLPAVSRQIESADLILVNKADLVASEILLKIKEDLKIRNPQALIIPTRWAEIPEDVLATTASTHRRGNIVSCDTPSSRPGTLQIEADGWPKDALDAFLHDQLGSTWRIKGWVKSDHRWWYVSDNAGHIEWEEKALPEGHLSGLTVITPPDRTEGVAKAWREFSAS